YVVDTNNWVELLRKNQKVKSRLSQRSAEGHEICIIPVVSYELLRGLEKRHDLTSITFIKTLWATYSYYEATKLMWDEAVRLWVMSTRQNTNPGDKDIFIASFATQLSATVATRNVRHFSIFQLPTE